MNPQAIILQPCTLVPDVLKPLLIHFTNFVHPVNIIDINLPINVLTEQHAIT